MIDASHTLFDSGPRVDREEPPLTVVGLAIAGAGQIVAEFLPFLRDVSTLTPAALFGNERSRENLEALAAEHGIPTVFTDFDLCLSDPAVNAVWVALPNSLHFEFSRRALLAGKHVICEKPFVLRPEELRELRDLAAERRLILIEAISTQYLVNYQRMRDLLLRLGDIRVVQCEYSQYSSRMDAFRRGEVLPAFSPSMGGGALMDLGIYALHLIVGLFGGPSAVDYRAHVERGVDTSGVAVLSYEGFTAVCVAAKDSSGPSRTKIQGTDGSLVMDGTPNEMGSFEIHLRGEMPQKISQNKHRHRMVAEFEAFAEMILRLDLDERDRRIDHSTLVLDAANRALESAGIRLG